MRFAVSLLFLCSFTFAQSLEHSRNATDTGPNCSSAAVARASACVTPKDLLAGLPLRFEQDAKNRWVTRGPGYVVGFQGNSATLITGGRALRLTFEGASGNGSLSGTNALTAPANYFTPQGYRQSKMFTRLDRAGLYPGIGVSYYGKAGLLEYDFNLAPRADASQIRMRFEGADSLLLNEKGEIVLGLGKDSVTQRIPAVYQRRESGELAGVEASYVLREDGAVGLRLGAYDPEQPVVIDPQLTYSAFLGGTGSDIAVAVARDSKNNIYLAGQTFSFDLPFGPISFNFIYQGNTRFAFVMELNPNAPSANVLLYTTYFGGPGTQTLTALAVDDSGKVYITGNTDSVGLPVSAVNTPFQSTLSATFPHPYIAVLDTTINGSGGLLYSTYLGGTGQEQSSGIATLNGKVYVTGFTIGDDFPVGAAYQTARAGGYDAFVSILDPTQSGAASLVYSTYFGGTGNDIARSIAVDANGVVYVSGYTFSTDFPTTNGAFSTTYRGGGDAFLFKLDPAANSLLYSTYVGGEFFEEAKKVVLIPGGQVALAGYTLSDDYVVTQNAYQPVAGGVSGNATLTVLKLNGQGPADLVYSTYLGGSGGDVAYDLRRDSAGKFYLCGYTLSTDFPVTNGALNTVPQPGGGYNGFVSIIDPAALPNQALVYSSYITGPGSQVAYGVEVDTTGVVYVVGYTTGNIFPAGAAVHTTGDGNFDPYLLGFRP